jgi:hypothetical protein
LGFSTNAETTDALASDLADLLRETYNASAVAVENLAALSDDSTFPTMVAMTVEFESEGDEGIPIFRELVISLIFLV